ncbi:MAG: sporulation protein [Eubacteriales bacterium]|nr:sporulation protein [Eubacteriales bacterium]
MSCLFSMAACALLLVLTTLYPAVCSQAVQSGLELCFTRAIPALFPFFVVSGLTIRCGLSDTLARLLAPVMRLYRLPSCGISALLLGVLGGYPTGAQTIAELMASGRCSHEDGARLVAFCNNTGPAFLIGMCGSGLFSSPRVGLYLYLTHLLSACLLGLLFRGGSRTAPLPSPAQPLPFAACFTQSVLQAGKSMLCVSAFILYFSVLLSLLSALGILPLLAGALAQLLPLPADVLQAVLTGGIELTSGLAALASCDASPLIRVSVCAGLCAFGGVSVLFQSSAAAPDLPFSRIFLGKLLHSVFCVALSLLLFPLCGL